MKYLIIFICCLCSSLLLFAKGDSLYIKNIHCLKEDTALIFEGGENIIYIYIPGVKGQDLKLKSLDRNLRVADEKLKGDTITAWAMPYTTDKKMRLAVVNKKTGKVYNEINFYGAKIPELRMIVGILRDSVVNKNDLLAQDMLRAVYPNSLYTFPYRIEKSVFRAHINGKDTAIGIYGWFLPLEVKKVIKALPPKTIITFTDILATCPGCLRRQLPDTKILVR